MSVQYLINILFGVGLLLAGTGIIILALVVGRILVILRELTK